MTALRSLGSGLVAMLTSPTVLLVLWLANLLPALVLAGLFFGGAQGVPARGAAAETAGFDWAWWVDFQASHDLFLSSLTGLSGWVVLGGLLLQTFLAGGVLEVLDSRGRRFTMERFFSGSARWFGAFFWILLLELALLWGLNLAWNGVLGDWVEKTWMKGLVDERWALGITLAQGLVFVFLFYVVRTACDYARVRTVVENRASFFLAFFAGWGFVVSHLWSVALLALFFALLNLGLVVLAAWGAGLLAGGALGQILLLLVLHQVFVLLRLGLRVGDYAAKLELFRAFREDRKRQGLLPSGAFGAVPPAAQGD